MKGLTIERQVHFARGPRSRKVIAEGPSPAPDATPKGTIPRIARLMALAIRFDRLIKAGEITDLADLARLGNVSRDTEHFRRRVTHRDTQAGRCNQLKIVVVIAKGDQVANP